MSKSTLKLQNPRLTPDILPAPAREVMDIRQAADYLGISADSLYRYAAEGTVPGFRLGNRWRFKKSRLDTWMDDQSTARPRKKPVRSVR